jgi:DNA-binding GntR family transcriptional regulator
LDPMKHADGKRPLMNEREHIYKAIKTDITSGRIKPGERLLEEKLAAQFEVSRTPIREVIRQLESEGLATAEKRKGATVTKLSVEEIDEIYSLRIILESYAASLTVKRLGKKERDVLREFGKSFIECAKHRKYAEWLAAGIRFHAFFAENCGNLTLYKIIDDLRSRVHRYQFIVTTNDESIARHTREHEAIIDGALKMDPRLTRRRMEAHLKSVYKELEKVLEHFPSI